MTSISTACDHARSVGCGTLRIHCTEPMAMLRSSGIIGTGVPGGLVAAMGVLV